MNNPTQFGQALAMLYATSSIASRSDKPQAYLLVALLETHINMINGLERGYFYSADVVEVIERAANTACTVALIELA